MVESNKKILQQANAAVSAGDNEGFLAHCADDVTWTTVGGATLQGKEAVRAWMAAEYVEPPRFTVRRLVGEGDLVIAMGEIEVADGAGVVVPHAYCDVWRFREGRMVELKAYVIALPT